ncbi:TetR/AcrR family transcriptional regulator [Curtobacterium sp. VKM Ac-2887]|nr:TetR/AcrR family transcriptional regulator [Curtobacterium sp. VKM Ac-2887]
MLQSARRRFAINGYGSTTVRDIASDAGVNVALINRYFTSKEGLFEACLSRTVAEFDVPEDDASTIDEVVDRMVQKITGPPSGDSSLQMLLLVRSSGDAAADRIRRQTLLSFTERMAAIAGWMPGDPETEHLLLRAQVAIATGLGIVMVRAATGLEPLTSAAAGELAAPLSEAVRVLLKADRSSRASK